MTSLKGNYSRPLCNADIRDFSLMLLPWTHLPFLFQRGCQILAGRYGTSAVLVLVLYCTVQCEVGLVTLPINRFLVRRW